MKFDNLGLPQDMGASDLQDSARLAGIMSVFNWPQKVPLQLYVISKGKYVRHPREIKYTFSRDQSICLLAGLNFQKLEILADPNYKTEGDFVSPSVRGHFKRCAGLKANWFQDLWLSAEIYFNAHFTPMNEPNQLICMLMVHPDKKYLKLWTDKNIFWSRAIRDYWEGWRQEPELSELMIKEIDKIINNQSR